MTAIDTHSYPHHNHMLKVRYFIIIKIQRLLNNNQVHKMYLLIVSYFLLKLQLFLFTIISICLPLTAIT